MSENPVFDLFEGVCPTCGKDVVVTGVCGVPGFVRQHMDYARSENAPTGVWRENSPDSLTDGELTFKCQNNHEFVVAHNIYGDWNL